MNTFRYLQEKGIIAGFLLLFLHLAVSAQTRSSITGAEAQSMVRSAQEVIVDSQSNPRFVRFAPNTKVADLSGLEEAIVLPRGSALTLKSQQRDNLGLDHFRYAQTFNGVEIVGAQMIFHTKGEFVSTANGNVYRELDLSTSPALSEESALKIALQKIDAQAYMWEKEGADQLLQREKKDPTATYFPKGKLVISSEKYEGQVLRLAYQFEVYATEPLGRYAIEVDAQNGEIINMYDKIHHAAGHHAANDHATLEFAALEGTGVSMYDGVVDMEIDFDGSEYTMADDSRGDGVFTYDMDNGEDYNFATLFAEPDSHFDEENSMAGVSAHFGTGATYDYFFSNFGRSSYDNAGAALNSYVHFSVGYFNAFWDGSRMTYGDGDGFTATALVSLDIVAHEVTHGVTEYSAGLIYAYESGALNESFSDIFGQAVEFETFPATASWLLGNQIFLDGVSTIRSMSDPNSQGHPDTYLGDFWYFGDGDNGGVHFNSGVQNFWFYLLVDGGTGTNDNGYEYSVPSIGLDAAQQIAYRNLTVYLTPGSNYIDARVGGEQAAIDLYGEGSAEHNAVVEAWNAVGVPTADPQLVVTDNLDFADVPIGLAVDIDVMVSNQGNALLIVDDIAIDNAAFGVSESSFSIEATSSKTITFTFTPSAVGSVSANAVFTSNGGDATLVLIGIGEDPPVLGVNPLSLTEALYTGETANQSITIDNVDGDSDLEWSIQTAFAQPAFAPIAERIPVQLIPSTKFDANAIYQSQDVVQRVVAPMPSATKVTASPGKLFVLNQASQRIEELDTETGSTLNSFVPPEGISGGPDGLAYDGEYLYFTNDWASGDIFKIDPIDGTVIDSKSYPLTIDALAHSGEHLFALDYGIGSIFKLDFDAGSVLEEINIGQFLVGGLTFASRRNSIFVSNFSEVVYELDAETYDVVGNFVPPGTIYGLGYSNALDVLFGANVDAGSIQALDPDDGSVLYEFPLGVYSALASDEASFLRWLEVAQTSGVISPGASQVVDVTFDAAGLNGGLYEATLNVSSNDPSNTLEQVQVSLDVTGAPDIAVAEEAVDFGDWFIGYEKEKEIVVLNEGTDLLSVSDVQVDNADYSVDVLTFAISPGEEQIIVVTYLPTALGADNANVSILSDDVDEPTLVVTISGVGIEAPVVDVSPTSLDEALFTGETATHLLTVDNSTGGSTLEATLIFEKSGVTPFTYNYAAPKAPQGAAPASSEVTQAVSKARIAEKLVDDSNILIVQDYAAWGVDMSDFILSSFGLSSTVINHESLSSTDLSNFDLVITVGDQSAGYYDAISAAKAQLEAFVSSGGRVQYQLATHGSDVAIVGDARVVYGSAENFNRIIDTDHPITVDLPVELEGFSANHNYLTDLPAGSSVLIETYNSVLPTMAEYSFGSGDVLVTGMTVEFLYYYDYNSGPLLGRMVEHSLREGSLWLQLSEESLSIPAGSSAIVEATFDAAGLYGGLYEGTIQVSSNDPATPLVSVPVSLDVTGAPDITVSETSLDYGQQFLNFEKEKTVTIRNDGTDLLIVSDIQIGNSDFVSDVTSFNLQPEEEQVVVIGYTPLAVESDNTTLTILSDDVDESSVEVSLIGSGIEPPIIGVDPLEMSEALFTGETSSQTHTLIIVLVEVI